MKSLFLHIGHPKTGSSYLQSLFAGSAGDFEQQRILYPLACPEVAKGKISSGNGLAFLGLLANPSRVSAKEVQAASLSDNSLLISSEYLFRFFSEDTLFLPDAFEDPDWRGSTCIDRMAKVLDWAVAQGFDEVKVLLFIRNPISLLQSRYQQRIKRGGLTDSINATAETFDTPTAVLRCLELFSRQKSVSVKVKNYSVVKDELDGVIVDWLGVDANRLVMPEVTRVNRSMTLSELELQRCLNEVFGPSGELIADSLCNELPTLKSDKVRISREIEDKIWQRQQAAIDQVNALIEPSQHYSFDRQTDAQESKPLYEFSAEQLQVIASSLGRHWHQTGGYTPGQWRAYETKLDKFRVKAAKRQERIEKLEARISSIESGRIENCSKLFRVLKPLFKVEKSINKRLKP